MDIVAGVIPDTLSPSAIESSILSSNSWFIEISPSENIFQTGPPSKPETNWVSILIGIFGVVFGLGLGLGLFWDLCFRD